MTLHDLRTGDYFRFLGSETVWQYRGNGWYSSLDGPDGGPWHDDAGLTVTLYECPSCGENHCPGCREHSQNLSCFV